MKKIRIAAILTAALLLCSCSATGGKTETSTEITTVPQKESDTVASDTQLTETLPEETTAEVKSIFDVTDGVSLPFDQVTVCTNTISKMTYAAMFKVVEQSNITVPALNQNFVPQGMDYWKEEGVLIISGYFNPATDKTNSVLLAVNIESGKFVGAWDLKNKDGSYHTGHDGGVAITESDIYLSTSSTLFRISLKQVLETGRTGELKVEEEIKVPVRASYCNYSHGMLWVGEFSLQGNSSYTITGHESNGCYAWTAGYEFDENGKLKNVPTMIISTPEKIQGFTVLDDGRIFMTCSYGRTNNSQAYIGLSSIFDAKSTGNATVSGKSVPIYDYKTTKTVTMIPMAEGCTCIGDKVYMLFESGAYYYRDYSTSKAKDPTDLIWIYDTGK